MDLFDYIKMVKRAYKQEFDFADADKYTLFLKKHLLDVKPTFYGVAFKRPINTTSGRMYAVLLNKNNVDDPSTEVIAECVVNDQTIYYWDDYCWATAVNENGHPIVRVDLIHEARRAALDIQEFSGTNPRETAKTLLLYQIGIDKVE